MRKNVLFCYSRLPSFTNAVRDYVDAFGACSVQRIQYYDMDSGPIEFELDKFDCIIFNYCFWARCLAVTSDFTRRVAAFRGLKIAIFQDEYDYFLWHRQTIIALGVQTIVTCVPEAHWRDVFQGAEFDGVEFIHALTGYVTDDLSNLPPAKSLDARAFSIGYRGRPVPFAYGRLTQEKVLIGERMKAFCEQYGVAANIEVTEEARIYGAAWPAFIGNCRAVLGTESGSNVFDFDGSVKPAIETYVATHPDADFETVHALFLKDLDGKIRMNQVSPRIFEAIAMRTGLVLFEGGYSGVVRPWEHYIPLKKDFSNVGDVLRAVSDDALLGAMTERAFNDIIASGRYHFRTFIRRIDAHIDAKVPRAQGWLPCLELVGWRASEDEPMTPLATRGTHRPTSQPLRHTDAVKDPFAGFHWNAGAFHRALMKRYEALLYSGTGQAIKRAIAKNAVIYALSRRVVRILTGRG